jgi:putative hydrolase of the HAD superfamily
VDAVIFDWGGTLTPWHVLDPVELWASVCAPVFPAADVAALSAALHAAESQLWRTSVQAHRSATMDALFELAGVRASTDLLASYLQVWEPHTYTRPDVPDLFRHLRACGIRVGVLSNTMWPRRWHDDVFRRDGVLDLIDGAVYTSEIDWTKPHPEAFRAAMRAIGVSDPARCVFVGDRPFDDVHGAQQAGLRAVLVPNSDVPPYASAVPDAVIGSLAELRPLLASWCAGSAS